MDKPIVQRLVGAGILVALGVIFIPIMLDGSGYKSRQVTSLEIPPRPNFPSIHNKQLKQVKPEENKQEKKSSAKKPVSDKPVHAWALQVGTFSAEANALSMRDELRQKGHPAYIDKTRKSGQDSYRVRIGPVIERTRVEKLLKEFKQKENIDGYVVNHP